MNTPQIVYLSVPRNKEQILRFAGIPAQKAQDPVFYDASLTEEAAVQKSSTDDSSLSLLDECLSTLHEEAFGRFVYLRVPIERSENTDAVLTEPPDADPSKDLKKPLLTIAGISIRSAALYEHLNGCDECLLLAATAGLTYDRFINKNSRFFPARALWYQAIGASAIESVLDVFCAQMEQEIGPLTSRFSPGYGDLPLTVQKDLFEVLKPEKAIGLTINESLLMLPTKSVTAIIGIRNTGHDELT